MPNRARNRGDYLERQTKAALIACGWVVTRAAGSLGAADLVALRADKKPLLISCKTDGRIPPHERAAIILAATQGGARPLLAYREKRGWVTLSLVVEGPERRVIDQVKVPSHAAP
jgi:Holliday junction resolvase